MSRIKHPIRAIREPFGTAGLIVAVIALVLALTGAAFAAGKLTSTQKKEVEKIAKKFAGKNGAPGAPGAQGAAGANGKDGANGANGESVTLAAAGACTNGGTKLTVGAVSKEVCNGENGAQGEPGEGGKSVTVTEFAGNAEPIGHPCHEHGGQTVQVEGSNEKRFVCNGSPAEFPTTLPSGRSLVGQWGSIVNNADVNFFGESVGLGSDAVTFPIPLASAPTPHYINEEGKEVKEDGSEVTSTACTGSAAAPTATSGNLCVYASLELGLTTFGPFTRKATVCAWGTESACNFGTSTPYGFGVQFIVEKEAEGVAIDKGTWAVKAP
jgi:hypothetical protein